MESKMNCDGSQQTEIESIEDEFDDNENDLRNSLKEAQLKINSIENIIKEMKAENLHQDKGSSNSGFADL